MSTLTPPPSESALLQNMKQLQQENRQLRLLLHLSQELGLAMDMSALVDKTLSLCKLQLGFDAANLRILEGDQLVTRGAYGGNAIFRQSLAVGDGLPGQAAAQGQPLVVNDLSRKTTPSAGLGEGKSLLAVPLTDEGELLGLLTAQNKAKGAFDASHMEITTAFAAQLAARLKILTLNQKMARLAMTDQLTGLPNYPHFLHRLEEEISRSERYGQALTLVLMDLDDFKQVNDRYGHLCGNFLLEFMGRFLEEKVRKSDIAARFGGEEFCMLLPHTTPQQGALVAEKLRIALNKVRLDYLPHVGEPVMDLRLSATFGVSGVLFDRSRPQGYPRTVTPVSLICQADEALYQGKAQGKNQVVTYTPAMTKNRSAKVLSSPGFSPGR